MAEAGVFGLTSIEYFGTFRPKSKNSFKIPIPPVVNSDKSTGLIYDVKPRKRMLEQLTQLPVMRMAYAADSYWALKSWRFIIPAQFNQTSVGGTLLCP